MNPLPPRLAWLHLRSRRAPLALALVIAIAAILRALQHWTTGSGVSARTLPLVLTVAAAAIIAASSPSPFGDPERATWPPPRLRLIQAAAFVPTAAGLLALARLGHDPLAAIRNLAGFTGLALITATVLNALLSWITPLAYALYCSGQIDLQAVNLWSWPALPSSNHTALLIALLLLGAGVTAITRFGARDREPAPT
jgi:hypothetical protein